MAARALVERDASQREVLGEALYPLVAEWCGHAKGQFAATLTGMMLELGAGLVLRALEDKAMLAEQLQRADAVLCARLGADAEAVSRMSQS